MRPGQQLVVMTDGGHRLDWARGPLRRAAAARDAGRHLQPGARGPGAGGGAARLHCRRARRRRRDPRDRPTPPGRAGGGRGPGPGRAPLRGLQPPRRRRDRRPLRRGDGFFPVGTAEAIGRIAPYVGPAGLHDYLERRRSGLGRAADHADRGRAPRCLAAGPRPRPRAQPRARHPRRLDGLDLGRRRRSLHPRRGLPRPRPGAAAPRRPSRIRRRDLHQPIQERHPHRDRRQDLEDHRVPARQAGQGRRLRADQAAPDRGRLGDRQNLPGRREVPPGPHRIEEDAVPLRLRRRGGLHGQPRLRADRDPHRGARRLDAVGPAERRGRGPLRRRTAQRRPGRRARSR